MVDCERCKKKITLSNIHVDKETGKATKYCRACAEGVEREGKNNMNMKKENEETIEDLTKEIQHLDHLPKSETGSETGSETDIVTRDMLVDSINSYLSEDPLNIKDGDFCYIRVVGNHLEIGRAKVVMDE
jgi:hypothetical protein